MTETIYIPTAEVCHQAPPIRIAAQYREAGSEVPAGHLPDIAWEKFTSVFHRPYWHGKEPSTTYRERYDDVFERESIPAREWQPISFKKEGRCGSDLWDANNVLLHAVVFDLENGISEEVIRKNLHGIKGLVHSTYRHWPTAPRWRVILPLRHPVGPTDWVHMRDALMHRFDALIDAEEVRPPWSWYRLPACPPDTKEHYKMFQLDGNALTMTPEFRLECGRSLHLKLQAHSRANVLAIPAKSDGGVTQASIKIATEPPSAIPTTQAAATHQTLDAASSPSISPASASANAGTPATEPAFSGSVAAVPSETVHASHEDLMAELEALAEGYEGPDHYPRIRDRYREISMALNRNGLWAPAFRPDFPIPRKKADLLPAHELIQQDRVVIDCHWLHSNRHHVVPLEARWRPIFKAGEEFPLALAEEFASRGVQNEYRAEAILALTHNQQAQLRALRGKVVQNLFKGLSGLTRIDGQRVPSPLETVALAINRWAEKDKRVAAEREKYMAHAKARMLLGSASPTRREIATLAGLIRGVPALSERTVCDLLKKIEKRVGMPV